MEIPILPEDAVFVRSAHLLAVRNAWSEAFGGKKLQTADPESLREVVAIVRKIVRSIDGAYATIIGGLAVQELGYVRWTDDADIVVDADHYGEVVDRLRAEGFLLKPDLSLEYRETKTKLDLLKEGAMLKNSVLPLPHPRDLGPNCGFATIEALVRMKLDAGGRLKDLADIVELLKAHPEEMDAIGPKLPEAMRAKFDELKMQARRELE